MLLHVEVDPCLLKETNHASHRSFLLTPAPNRFGLPAFYALHAWAWKKNPAGTFQPWNPKVRCP